MERNNKKLRNENFRVELAKYREKYDEADNMVFRLRQQRDTVGFDDIKTFNKLTDEINIWSNKRESARKGMHEVRLCYDDRKKYV